MKLADEWIALYRTKTNAPFRNKKFMAKYNSIDRRYKKLSKPLKAKFDQLIHRHIRSKDYDNSLKSD